jgi:uncharacterized membrane protein
MEHQHPANQVRHDLASFGSKAADWVCNTMGSWRFIAIQTAFVAGWIIYNCATGRPFDPFPFILLNLAFSTQAAYASPVILMGQNQQSEHDRQRAEADYACNEEALALLRGIAAGEIALRVEHAELLKAMGKAPSQIEE